MTEAQVAALRRVLGFRWKGGGYGRYTCASCGALRSVDYGDHDQPMTEKREPCSRSCPWAIVEAWAAETHPEEEGQ